MENLEEYNRGKGEFSLCLGDFDFFSKKEDWKKLEDRISDTDYDLGHYFGIIQKCQSKVSDIIFRFMYNNFYNEISNDKDNVDYIKSETIQQLNEIPNLNVVVDLHPLICFYTNALLHIEKLKQMFEDEISNCIHIYRWKAETEAEVDCWKKHDESK